MTRIPRAKAHQYSVLLSRNLWLQYVDLPWLSMLQKQKISIHNSSHIKLIRRSIYKDNTVLGCQTVDMIEG
jgi:hypothetical protein